MIPKQPTKRARMGTKAGTDHSKAPKRCKKGYAASSTPMAKRPAGTAVVMPGGRKTRAKGYPG